ncbi:hypothetical protein VMF7928_04445 [Vibrio marisflavi CECT 7928]|uniref:Uncharacterized protein n=1 Tax=Vibrio marisflavi CECT 7928 TaxID=634439 RepID=A0ABM9A9U1_9VIBR|nr:hypothetical protein VMF7928_04445 [Vibrio marisflavi CECT 7928]
MLSYDLCAIPEVDAFFSSIHNFSVAEFGGTYSSFYHESQLTKNKLFWTSETSWGKVYVENNYIQDCHLMNFGRKVMERRSYTCFPWSAIREETRAQKNISGARREHNIDLGLSMANLRWNCVTGLALSTFPQNKVFSKDLLHNMKLLNLINYELFKFATNFNALLHKTSCHQLDLLKLSYLLPKPDISKYIIDKYELSLLSKYF